MAAQVIWAHSPQAGDAGLLRLNSALVADWLIRFLKDECIRRRHIHRAVIAVSGGVDSAVTAYLSHAAFGRENVFAFYMPYTVSSPESHRHAELVCSRLGIGLRDVDITAMVNGYVHAAEPDMSPLRLGNVCARARMIVLYDQSAKLGGLPIGTSNKSERLLGYFTWHGDDAPPINPLGDLFKVQVWDLARQLGVPDEIVNKPATADLVADQSDEGDLGFSYRQADPILHFLTLGYSPAKLIEMGYEPRLVKAVSAKVEATHWKRRPATVAMLSASSIGDYYLRPVDF
jgi:NAD+ synthase